MGIDTTAVIVVGLPQSELGQIESLCYLINNEDLEVISPFYDGKEKECSIIGLTFLSSKTYEGVPFAWDESKILELKETFKKITGKTASVWLSAMVK